MAAVSHTNETCGKLLSMSYDFCHRPRTYMDIGPTIKRYKHVCEELKVKTSDFIRNMLEKEKKHSISYVVIGTVRDWQKEPPPLAGDFLYVDHASSRISVFVPRPFPAFKNCSKCHMPPPRKLYTIVLHVIINWWTTAFEYYTVTYDMVNWSVTKCVFNPIPNMCLQKWICLFSSNSMYWGMYLAGNNKHMTSTRLTDDDVNALYCTLRNCMYITHLDLRYNRITDKGCEYLQKFLEVGRLR